jgi:hypothetical protein
MTDALAVALQARRNHDGGYGPYPGVPSTTESTAWAALGLASSDGEAVRSAVAWLLEHQLPSGAWPHSEQDSGASWMTSAALLALAGEPSATEAVRHGATWLLRQRGRASPLLTRLFYRFWPERVQVRLDIELRAWPWTGRAFSWCEPTSMAMLALDGLDRRLVPGTVEFRLREGERLLLDRVCAGGGWNYGNSWVLGEELWPYPDTTALALLALLRRRGHPTVTESLAALERMLEAHDSSLALALGVLSLEPYGVDVTEYRDRLRSLWSADPVETTSRAIALSVLALEGTPNPFLRRSDHG